MSRRKKIAVFSLATFLLLSVAAYFVANYVLEKASRRALAKIVQLADKRGLQISAANYKSVALSGIFAATWEDLEAKVSLPEGPVSSSDQRWQVNANQLKVSRGFTESATLEVDRLLVNSFRMEPDDNKPSPPKRTLEINDFRCQCKIQLADPMASVKRLFPKLIVLLSDSRTQLPVKLTGKLSFSLRDKLVETRIEVQREENQYAILLNHADVKKLSQHFNEQLTAAEVAIVASHPLRAPRLLQIKNTAESTARKAHEQDSTVPEDAYRHILWSFLLARGYGEEFAKQVGDAHEAGDTGNTPAERQMDLNNNAVGRRYAKEEYAQQTILSRLRKDLAVRVSP